MEQYFWMQQVPAVSRVVAGEKVSRLELEKSNAVLKTLPARRVAKYKNYICYIRLLKRSHFSLQYNRYQKKIT